MGVANQSGKNMLVRIVFLFLVGQCYKNHRHTDGEQNSICYLAITIFTQHDKKRKQRQNFDLPLYGKEGKFKGRK